jgi:hypothetical protein
MRQAAQTSSGRPRITVDVDPAIRRRVRMAALQRDVTVSQYVLEALEDRLRVDAPEDAEPAMALTAESDPVLAELWDNEMDAAYDRT